MTLLKNSLCYSALFLALATSSPAGSAQALIETPMFEAAVRAGQLPEVKNRLPDEPDIVRFDGTDKIIGRHGGNLRSLIRTTKDVKLIGIYGYARLVGRTSALAFAPDLLRDYRVDDGRIFTLYLRRGHKWSDGHPFTTEDFRYWWEDIANNKELTPVGPPKVMLSAGALPAFEIIDATTIRISWASPNPDFLRRLAGASPLFIFRPAHYLKQFHVRYGDPDRLSRQVKAARVSGWAALHHQKDGLYLLNNPEQPTLNPWLVKTKSPSDKFLAVRNPYYHRIDEAGRQLPYFDRVTLIVTTPKLIPAKAGTGESDLQGRGLALADFTFLKENEKRYGFGLRLWRKALGAQMALFPNLNTSDPNWRNLMRQKDFRHALSLAIDREAVNEFLFHGLANPSNNTVLPESPLYKDKYRRSWIDHDPDQANDLLDKLGLKRKEEGGLRYFANGKKLQIVVETSGEQPEQIDILELVGSDWLEIGVELVVKPSHRATIRARLLGGDVVMSAWPGIQNGVPLPSSSPIEFVPFSQLNGQWPLWGVYEESSGQQGKRADLPIVQRLLDLYRDWRRQTTADAQAEIWHKILAIHAEESFSIGILAGVPQPVVVSNQLVNVPKEGLYNFEPGAFFGIYRPDTFWLKN